MKTGLTLEQLAAEITRQQSAKEDYVVNTGNASEAEYVELLSAVRRAVAERHGFYLRPEVKFLNPESEKKVTAQTVSNRWRSGTSPTGRSVRI